MATDSQCLQSKPTRLPRYLELASTLIPKLVVVITIDFQWEFLNKHHLLSLRLPLSEKRSSTRIACWTCSNSFAQCLIISDQSCLWKSTYNCSYWERWSIFFWSQWLWSVWTTHNREWRLPKAVDGTSISKRWKICSSRVRTRS